MTNPPSSTRASLACQDGLGAAPEPLLTPVAFSFATRRVRLLDLRGINLRENAFLTAVRKVADDHPERAPVEMDWSAYLAAVQRWPLLSPAGFLFNVARCGSTLLANMLDAVPGALTIKESGTVGMLLHRWLRVATSEAERRDVQHLLAVTLSEFGRLAIAPYGDAATALLFVKPHSWATLLAAPLMALFPETPGLFLYRDPFAVVASMLAKPPYQDLRNHPQGEVASLFPSLAGCPDDLSPASFYAHLWRSPVEAALALPLGRLLLLDYAELTANSEASIARLTRHFGIVPDSTTVARMLGAMALYAKDASGSVRFDAHGLHLRPSLTPDQHADVQSVVGDLYARLTTLQDAQA